MLLLAIAIIPTFSHNRTNAADNGSAKRTASEAWGQSANFNIAIGRRFSHKRARRVPNPQHHHLEDDTIGRSDVLQPSVEIDHLRAGEWTPGDTVNGRPATPPIEPGGQVIDHGSTSPVSPPIDIPASPPQDYPQFPRRGCNSRTVCLTPICGPNVCLCTASEDDEDMDTT